MDVLNKWGEEMRAKDADALIAWIKGSQQMTSKMKCVIAKIETMPGAVSVVQGKWILLEPRYPIEQKVYWSKEQAIADTKGNGARERRKCSCCGYTKSFMCHMKDEQIKLWNFCPNCGARMFAKDINVHNKEGADDEEL